MNLEVTIQDVRNLVKDAIEPYNYMDSEIEFVIEEAKEFAKTYEIPSTAYRGRRAILIKAALILTLQDVYLNPNINTLISEISEHDSRIKYNTANRSEFIKNSRTEWEKELNAIVSDMIVPVEVYSDYD